MAIIGTIGRDITVVTSLPTTNTYIAKRDPATISGKIYTVIIETVSLNTPHTANLKIFRINGTDYDVVYNQDVSGMVASSENEITLTIPFSILVGDLLGYWCGTAGSLATLGYEAGSGTGYSYKTGNVTTTTAIGDWSSGTETIGLRGNITNVPGGGFSGGQPMMF